MTRFPAAKILLTAVAVSASFCAFSAGQNTIPEELIAAAKRGGGLQCRDAGYLGQLERHLG